MRAAWLHYAGGLTQAEVAKRLGIKGLKAHRLITRANQEGLVKVFIDADITECFEFEQRLITDWGLEHCQVVPDLEQEELPLKALGIGGAGYLLRVLQHGEHLGIGVGHGRTLGASIEHLPARALSSKQVQKVHFVSLLGGLSRNFAANPHDVIHRLAHRTGAQAFVMPVPFVANSVSDKQVLLGQRGIQEVLELARQTSLKLVGIGTTELHSSLVATGLVEASELNEIATAGGVGELLGYFFNADGEPVDTQVSDRTLALPLDDLRNCNIVAVAGGEFKTEAIRAVLASRLLSGLITDERTARTLLG